MAPIGSILLDDSEVGERTTTEVESIATARRHTVMNDLLKWTRQQVRSATLLGPKILGYLLNSVTFSSRMTLILVPGKNQTWII